jgi:stage IV sporulation protein FB
VGRNSFSAALLFIFALALLLLPIQWIGAVTLAAVFHELCHYAAVRLCGGKINGVAVGLSGAQMGVAGVSAGKELFCALAGPAGSLALLLFSRWLPRTAVCAGFQGIYNLLPIYPLDGGRVIRCLTELLFPFHVGERICRYIEIMCISCMIFLALYGCFVLHLGILPLMVAASVILRRFPGKIPCKPQGNSVQ